VTVSLGTSTLWSCAFVAVATGLHFGRAAGRLHTAPPTLSELIRHLERELGTPLFTRTPRQVAMISAGAELLARSKVILDEVAAAEAAVRRIAAPARSRQMTRAPGCALSHSASVPAYRPGRMSIARPVAASTRTVA
jgi:DNA-binding transcriptional LysR family regulator